MLFKVKILMILTTLLVLSFLSCSTFETSAIPENKRPVKFDGKWSFVLDKKIKKACLSEKDVIKLRKILIDCGCP